VQPRPLGPLVLVVGPALSSRRAGSSTPPRSSRRSAAASTVEPNPSRARSSSWSSPASRGRLVRPAEADHGGRPAVAVAFLRGFETPDIRQKAGAGNSQGGGALSPDSGDFDDDSVRYRVRHVTGAASVDPIHTYALHGRGLIHPCRPGWPA
jgi:hypothetical protein